MYSVLSSTGVCERGWRVPNKSFVCARQSWRETHSSKRNCDINFQDTPFKAGFSPASDFCAWKLTREARNYYVLRYRGRGVSGLCQSSLIFNMTRRCILSREMRTSIDVYEEADRYGNPRRDCRRSARRCIIRCLWSLIRNWERLRNYFLQFICASFSSLLHGKILEL